jgi:hypothetical protein
MYGLLVIGCIAAAYTIDSQGRKISYLEQELELRRGNEMEYATEAYLRHLEETSSPQLVIKLPKHF